MGEDARDERRVLHLDQHLDVARVGVGDDPARAAVARGGREQLAPVGAAAGRDDHHVARLLRVDGGELAAVVVLAVGRRGVDLDDVHRARVAGEPRLGVQRADVRGHQVVAHADLVEAVADDRDVDLREPIDQGEVTCRGRRLRVHSASFGPS